MAIIWLPPLCIVVGQQARTFSGIRILEEAHKAQENLYWAQEDERLIRKMLENHPEMNPEYQGISGLLSNENKLEDKVKLVFMKHGIPPVNKALINDIVKLVEIKE